MAKISRNKDAVVHAQCHLSNAHSHSMQMACLIGIVQIRRPVPLRRMRATVNQKHLIHVPEKRKRKQRFIICSLVPAWCSCISFWKTSLCANQISLYELRFFFLPYQKVVKSFKKTRIWKLFFDVVLSLSLCFCYVYRLMIIIFFANCICSCRKKNSKQVFSIISLLFLQIIEGKETASPCNLYSRHLSIRRILFSFATLSM